MHWLLRWNPYTYGVTMIIWSTFLRFLACSSIIEEICMLSTRAFGYHPHSRKACWNSTSFFLGSPNVSLEKKQQFFFEKWRSWKNVFFRILRLKWHLLHEILISRRRKRKQKKKSYEKQEIKRKGKRKRLDRGGVPEIELLCFSAFNEVSLNLLHLHETLLRLRPRHGFSLVCENFTLPRNRNQNQKNRHSTVMEETDCKFSIIRGMPLPSRPLSFSLFLHDALPHTSAP